MGLIESILIFKRKKTIFKKFTNQKLKCAIKLYYFFFLELDNICLFSLSQFYF